MSDTIPLGPGREFDIIRTLLRRWGTSASGIGDDAAVLDVPPGEHLAVSADSSVEDVHFRRSWITPYEVGWRATAAALSDLAAMGATPLGMLVSLSVPSDWLAELDAVADGIGDAARAAAAPILGGDLTSATALTLAITVLGHGRALLRRNGACVGDVVYITGRLGGPLLAIRAWSRGERPSPAPRERFAHPVPRLAESRWLERAGAHAAIDISDGLLGDAAHLAAASAVRVVLTLDELPTIAGATPLDAAASGEEYELLIAAPAGLDAAGFEREFGVPLTPIGRVEAGPAEVWATFRGERVAPAGGFSHFS